MTRCEGSSAKQALANRRLRDGIVTDPQVTKLFHVYTLDEGTVAINHNRAYEHVRNCINTMKKAKTYMPSHSMKTEPLISNGVYITALPWLTEISCHLCIPHTPSTLATSQMCTYSLHIPEDIEHHSVPDNYWCCMYERQVKFYKQQLTNMRSPCKTFADRTGSKVHIVATPT